MKFALVLVLFCTAAYGQQTMKPDGMGGWVIDNSPCAGLSGYWAGECEAKLQQGQEERNAQQLENLRLQNELLRLQIEQRKSNK